MSLFNSFPKVALIGRVNVGKSSLFNRLSSATRALVMDVEGVTRDPLYDIVEWRDKTFILVDTGGFETKKRSLKDPFYESIFKKTMQEIEEATIVALVIDGKEGLSKEDFIFISKLRKNNTPFILLINKSDVTESEYVYQEALGMGIPYVILVSASHGKGIEDFCNSVVEILHEINWENKKIEEADKAEFKVSFLGRPNVGKSSLMNALLKKERSMISEIAGTTRETVTDQIAFYNQVINISDTAGVRRSRNIDEPLEEMMVSSTMESIKKAHIILLVIDLSQDALYDQDIKLAFYAFQELHKAVVVIWNKIDLVENPDDVIKSMTRDYKFLFDHVLQLRVSAKSGKNVGKIMPALFDLWKKYNQEFDSDKLNGLFQTELAKRPLVRNKQVLNLFRCYQLHKAPPTFMLMVKNKILWDKTHIKFFENILRKEFDLVSVPLKFVLK